LIKRSARPQDVNTRLVRYVLAVADRRR
jgi:hypothetical protein